MISVSIDIGSTWTKGAVFEVTDDSHIEVRNYALSPTTPHHLAEGFFSVLNKVLDVRDARPMLASGELNIDYSSSAKGGLPLPPLGWYPVLHLSQLRSPRILPGLKCHSTLPIT